MAHGPTSEKSDIGETTSVFFLKEVSKTHTFVLQAAITVFDQPLEAEFGRWNFLSAVADYKKAEMSTGRHQAISFKLSSWDWSLGADCLRYDAVSEDHGSRRAPPGSFLTLTEHGYICVHPELDASAVLIYSERLAPGEQPVQAFEEEGETFLRGLEFTPKAASDSPKRQFTQGLRYFFGHGIARDRGETVKLLCQAARKGSADAAILLNAMQSEYPDDDKLRASILSLSPAVALAALRDTFGSLGTDITRLPAVCESKAD